MRLRVLELNPLDLMGPYEVVCRPVPAWLAHAVAWTWSLWPRRYRPYIAIAEGNRVPKIAYSRGRRLEGGFRPSFRIG